MRGSGTFPHALQILFAASLSGCVALNDVAIPTSSDVNSTSLSVAGVSSISIAGPTAGLATYCSDPFIATLKDATGAIATTTEDLTITLSGSGAGAFYSDAGCATPLTTMAVPTGSSIVTFYVNSSTPAALTVSLAIARLGASTINYTVNPNDYTIAVFAGDTQSGTVATALSLPLVAVVKDAADNVVNAATVDWTSTSGTLGSASSVTDSSGLASTTFTLPTVTGSKSIVATVRGTSATATFSASASAGAAAAISVASGNNQSGGVSTSLSNPLVAFVSDAYGNAVFNATVNWTKSAGALGSASSTSNAAGAASTTFTLGATSGAHTITATLNGTAISTTFTATGSSCVGSALTAAPFGSGDGSSGTPYLVCTPTQFNQIADNTGYMAKYFLLDADLDMTGVSVSMIGSTTHPFTGTFDGGNHTISNLTITTTADNTALFSYTGGSSVIKNLNFSTATISAGAHDNVGVVVGYANTTAGTIQNISVTGATVSGRDYVGGIIGTHNYWAGTITVTKTSAVSSSISGRSYVGGIIGNFMNGTFTKNMARANVTGTSQYDGGLAGYWNGGGTFADSYATHDGTYGTITGTANVGGAIGAVNNSGVAQRIFSTGTVTSAGTKSGLIGSGSGTLSSAFWDTQTSGISAAGAGYGTTTAILQDITPYLAKDFDFAATWAAPATGGYPTLQWMNSSYSLPTLASLFGGGTGTSGDPYLISTNAQLKNLAYAVNMSSTVRTKYFKLTAIIDMAGVKFGGIGSVSTPFAGYLDGNSKTISNLTISLPYGASAAGLFAAVAGGNYHDLTLASPSITAATTDNVGSLIGYSTAGTIASNITVTNASITGQDYTGAIWGQYTGCFNCGYVGSLTGAAVSGSTISGRDFTGGMVGSDISGSTFNLQTSKVTSTSVSGRNRVGGIIGQRVSGTFAKNYAIANVTASASYAGGLIGYWWGNGSVTDSFSRFDGTYGTINAATDYAGGAIGYINNAGNLTRVFAANPVSTSGAHKGGLIGDASGTAGKDSFWDTTVSGIAAGSGYGTGYDSATLQNTNLFASQDYDFSASWTVPVGSAYPSLQWDATSYSNPTLASLLTTGAGTSGSPYEIGSADTLKNMVLAVNLYSAARTAYYKLTADLNMNGTPFAGVGSVAIAFAGYFDGNNKTISNLTLLVPAKAGMAGLFNNVSGGSYHDLTINSLTINAPTVSYVGGIIGYSTGTATVSNVTITSATITGSNYTGGIWGQYAACFNCPNTGTISGSSVSGATIAGNNYVGGLIGSDIYGSTFNLNTSRVTNSTVSGANYIGGILGSRSSGGTLTRVSANANVTGSANRVAGIAGLWNGGGTFSNVASLYDGTKGTITGVSYVGGVIGEVTNSTTPSRLFSSSPVVATSNKGGLVGTGAGGAGADSFWDSDVATGVAGGWGVSKSTADAQTAATYAAWDLTTVWNAVDGSYPTLR